MLWSLEVLPPEPPPLAGSVRRLSGHRQAALAPLGRVLDCYGDTGQARWAAWRRKQQLDEHLPDQFAEVVTAVVAFADPVIAGPAGSLAWDPAGGAWTSVTDPG